MNDDVKVSQRYRALATEEPPRALDDAILAAAREAQRPWTRRYAVPLGLAAVLVLSVTVTLRIQHEQPGIEAPGPVAKAPAPAEVAQADTLLKLKVEAEIKPPVPERRAKAELKDRARQDEPRPFAQPMGEQARESVAAAAPPAAAPAPAVPAFAPRVEIQRGTESSVAGAAARQAEERTSRDAAAASRAPQAGPVQALAKRAEVASAPTPEQELERIALLRREGKHDEADKALAEFRKRLPDYKIPAAMLEKVERR